MLADILGFCFQRILSRSLSLDAVPFPPPFLAWLSAIWMNRGELQQRERVGLPSSSGRHQELLVSAAIGVSLVA